MSIHATLHIHPTARPSHDLIYITRGASATLTYFLYDKTLDLDTHIEQITFTFKQGKVTHWCTMFDFITDDDGNITRQLDPHFYYNAEYGVVLFNLTHEETKQLKPGIPVEYEVAIKLNTDSFASLGSQDSVIIEAQHPIEVIDSLFSHIEEN